MLQQIGIDDKDYRIIHTLYFQQKAAIKLTKDLSHWIDIRRGVRQGCVMSTDFFNFYSEFILRELEEIKEGIQINGQRIKITFVISPGCINRSGAAITTKQGADFKWKIWVNTECEKNESISSTIT